MPGPRSRYGRRTDGNHAEIVRALRAAGITVVDLSAIGEGCPDLLIGFGGVNSLIEIKTATGGLDADQVDFIDGWRGARVAVVRDSLAAIQVATRAARGCG